MSLALGTHLGPYEILSPLGAGGMGEVYRARDARLNRDVAVKVLPSHLAEDPVALGRFEREAKSVAATSHPNILAIFDVGRADRIAFAVTELLEGGTLRARLGAGPIPVRKVIEYAVQIAEGLGAAHDKGIVHRDLKPENLFVTKDGRVKILDFGLARQILVSAAEDTSSPTLSEPGTMMGTMGYMSPEQIRGKPADHRSDLFSFGAVLYEMLTGRRAFKGETPADTLTAILAKDPPEFSTVNGTSDPTLERITRRCLEKEPEARFQSARDLGFALETLSGLSAPAMPPAALEPARNRRSLTAVVLPLILVGVVTGAFFLGERLNQRPIPSFHQLTFRRGTVAAARFTPDGQTIVYSAAWDGGLPELFSARPDTVESRALGISDARLLATAPGEMAVLLRRSPGLGGVLARASLAGGALREVAHHVYGADWTNDGARFAAVTWAGGVSQIEFPLGKVVYKSEFQFANPRISPAGDRIAFLEGRYEQFIRAIDSSGKTLAVSRGWKDTTGLAWSPNGREVWFTGEKEGGGYGLHALSLDGHERVIARTAGTITLQDIARDGRTLLTHSRPRREMVGLTPGDTRERNLSWLDDTQVHDLSDDGRSLLFIDHGAVYLRHTDGSDPIRLCDGSEAALSPDGKWVVARTKLSQLTLFPTGAGQARPLPRGSIDNYQGMYWFPDGARLLINGTQAGRGIQMFVQDVSGGAPRVIASEDTFPNRFATQPISPDGRLVAVSNLQGPALCPTGGDGEPRPLPGLGDADVLRWSADPRYLFVQERTAGLPIRIQRLDLETGRKERWKELQPSDTTGVERVFTVFLTPDGRSYVYSYQRDLSELYLVEGLR